MIVKRKKSKLIEFLTSTNWSKINQQISNLNKLNRLLVVSAELNQLDDKNGGQSVLSIVVSSPQINSTVCNIGHNSSLAQKSNSGQNSLSNVEAVCNSQNGLPLSSLSSSSGSLSSQLKPASLISMQCQSSGLDLNQVLSTSVSDLIVSRAPLVERIIQLTVRAGARLDLANSDGKTPLHVAASKSNFWALKTLLDLGAESDCQDSLGLTPLYYSIIERADLKVTQLLLSHQCQSYANYNYTNNNNNNNSFNKTSNLQNESNSCPTNEQEIKNGDKKQVDNYFIGNKDQHGWQEVHQACKLGLDTHLEKLLYYGCDINAKIDGSGNTPLHVAAINDQINCAKILLLRGADKSIINSSHQTAHQTAIIAGNMDLAEFISDYSSSQVIPFRDRPSDFIRGFGANNQLTHANTLKHIPKQQLHYHHNHNQQQPQQQQTPQYQQHTNPVKSNMSNLSHFDVNSLSRHLSTRSVLVNSQSSFLIGSNNHHSSQRISDNQRLQQFQQKNQKSNQQKLMTPLSLELFNQDTLDCFPNQAGTRSSFAGPSSSGLNSSILKSNAVANSITSSSSSMLPGPVDPSELHNVSPCLSQRSFATSNTTSSSGVYMDGDCATGPTDDSNIHGSIAGSLNRRHMTNMNQSLSQHSNITVISIGQKGPASLITSESSTSSLNHDDRDIEASCQSDDASSTGSTESCNDLFSLMLDEKPLAVGSIVESITDYQSGDPNHLQLHRGDLIEILMCRSDLLQCGLLPRLANKPMLYGRTYSFNRDSIKRINQNSNENCGLFPSFCVRRTKMQRVKNHPDTNNSCPNSNENQDPNQSQSLDETLTESSQVTPKAQFHNNEMNPFQMHQLLSQSSSDSYKSQGKTQSDISSGNACFEEFNVCLTKTNSEGFGFILRGAKINPSFGSANNNNNNHDSQADANSIARLNQNHQSTVLSESSQASRSSISIDDNMMRENNLASLQYLDEIEPGSVADKAGLKRGDFLIAVNNHDVRLQSHEQVVQMIRDSGIRVQLTIATTANLPQNQMMNKSISSIHSSYASTRTLGRIKPEPPKRDPTTTLSRNNKTRETKSKPRDESIMESLITNNPTISATTAAAAAPVTTTSTSVSTNIVDDTPSLASTVSLRNTPTHSTSSGSTQTTIEANTIVSQVSINSSRYQNKNQLSNKSSINSPATMNNAKHETVQPTYQPAVITTTIRRRQSVVPINNSNNLVNSTNKAQKAIPSKSNLRNDTGTDGPPPPPPPPPLPPLPPLPVSAGADIPKAPSRGPISNNDNRHRYSIQVDNSQALQSLKLDPESLRLKRASLANVNAIINSSANSSTSSQGGGPELGSVAAACAAAANDRKLRQLRQQPTIESDQQIQLHHHIQQHHTHQQQHQQHESHLQHLPHQHQPHQPHQHVHHHNYHHQQLQQQHHLLQQQQLQNQQQHLQRHQHQHQHLQQQQQQNHRYQQQHQQQYQHQYQHPHQNLNQHQHQHQHHHNVQQQTILSLQQTRQAQQQLPHASQRQIAQCERCSDRGFAVTLLSKCT